MIILDFDGVLFDHRRFKGDYRRMLRRQFGIPYQIYEETYAEARTARRHIYHHAAHLVLIRKTLPVLRHKDIERVAKKLLGRSATYLYKDAESFLSYWKAKKQTLALISNGFAFQKKKVAQSGLAGFFRRIIITDSHDKVAPLRTLIGRSRPADTVFIDDKKRLVDAVKKRFPAMVVIQLVRRKAQERSERADIIVPNLAAARRFIEKVSENPVS